MQRTQINVATPADFNFGSTVNSHGWERLEPFSLNREHQVLTRIERLPSQLSRLEITHDDKINVTVHSETKLNKDDKSYVTEFITHCFSFNWDMSKCYAKVTGDTTYSFIKEERLGRLFLALSMWENLVKTQFLTNTHARQRHVHCLPLQYLFLIKNKLIKHLSKSFNSILRLKLISYKVTKAKLPDTGRSLRSISRLVTLPVEPSCGYYR